MASALFPGEKKDNGERRRKKKILNERAFPINTEFPKSLVEFHSCEHARKKITSDDIP